MLRAGVDLGGTKIQVVIVDPLNQILGSHRMPTPTTGGPADVTDALAEAVRRAGEDALVDPADITGVGVGGPGQVDAKAGTLSRAGNLPGWMGTYPLAPELSRRLHGVDVSLANDVYVSVLSEVHLGAGRPYQSMIGIFCGTGVGGGIVLNRKMWKGRGAGGEKDDRVVGGGPERVVVSQRIGLADVRPVDHDQLGHAKSMRRSIGQVKIGASHQGDVNG